MAPTTKRFYDKVSIALQEQGTSFYVTLDGRPVKTPAKRDLALPTQYLAECVAAEFDRQSAKINPATMPLTRLANTVIDGIADNPHALVEDIMRFIGGDVILYRASEPIELAQRQRKAFDPILDFIMLKFGSHFEIATNITFIPQPREAYIPLRHYLNAITSPFILGSLHSITTLTGSGLLALALKEGAIDGKSAWAIAHLEEDWNIEHWGQDEEAAQRRQLRSCDFDAALAFLTETVIDESL